MKRVVRGSVCKISRMDYAFHSENHGLGEPTPHGDTTASLLALAFGPSITLHAGIQSESAYAVNCYTTFISSFSLPVLCFTRDRKMSLS